MASFFLVSVLCAAAVWQLFRQWRIGQGSSQFPLGILPTALLFVTASIPGAVWDLVRGFSRIAESGAGGLAVIAPFCLGITRALWWGTAGFLVVMATGLGLQIFARSSARPSASAQTVEATRPTWARGVVVASTLLTIPVAFLSHLTQGIPRLAMRASIPGRVTVEDIGQVSATITSHSLLAMTGGVLMTAVVGGFAIANIRAARSSALDSLAQYSWVVLAGVGPWAVWSLVQLTADINGFQAALP